MGTALEGEEGENLDAVGGGGGGFSGAKCLGKGPKVVRLFLFMHWLVGAFDCSLIFNIVSCSLFLFTSIFCCPR